MDNSTTFTNRMTVRAYESKHQCKIHVRPHKTKEGIYLYYHSNAEDASAIGLVSQRAVDLLSVEGDSAWDKLMIADCHYIDNTGKQQTCKMLMLSNLEMNTKAYPLISEYVEAIKLAEDNLEQLSYLRPVLDSDGNPVMSSGNFAVVFKMKDERNGKLHAMKCFIKDQEGRNEAYKLIADELEFVSSEFIIPIKFFEKELFVDTSNSEETEFPVLLMDWVNGVTLDKYVRKHLHDQYALQLISYQFCRLAAWLMAQPFAHGDLKPDNILVKDDGSLVLVDYDGMFVPAMKGQRAREVGSPDYRHPTRSIDDFNESIDDFSLATIAMQLYAIALRPDLLMTTVGDTLLLCENDYRDLEKSEIMTELFSQVGNPEFEKLLAIFLLAHSEMSLSKLSFRIFNINKPSNPTITLIQSLLSTEVMEDDISNGLTDRYGVVYSRDGMRLLKAVNSLTSYQIKAGTFIICESAFRGCSKLQHIEIPDSVIKIGKTAFCRCNSLQSIEIPNSVINIDALAFSQCTSLQSIVMYNSVLSIGHHAFLNCKSLHHIELPNSLTSIREAAFARCESLSSVTIPNSVTYIGNRAFLGCSNLKSALISSALTYLDNDVFKECTSLESINIPSSVKTIGDFTFMKCESLKAVRIPNSVTSIGNGSFYKCRNLQSIEIPDSVIDIGPSAFAECESMHSIVLSNSLERIGIGAFSRCKKLKSIEIPKSVCEIDSNPFSGSGIQTVVNHSSYFISDDKALYNKDKSILLSFFGRSRKFNIPSSVTSIASGAFARCKTLQSIQIPSFVTYIGSNPFIFSGLRTLECNSSHFFSDDYALYSYDGSILISYYGKGNMFKIPNSVTIIGDWAFAESKELQSIEIPQTVTTIGNGAFLQCSSIQSIVILNPATNINNGAFYKCESLSEIIIPKGTMSRYRTMLIFDVDKLKEV